MTREHGEDPLDDAAAAGRTVIPSCSFVADWIARHPGYERLVQP